VRFAYALSGVELFTDRWTTTMFVNSLVVDNMTNRVAELTVDNTQFKFNIARRLWASTSQPRTCGVRVD